MPHDEQEFNKIRTRECLTVYQYIVSAFASPQEGNQPAITWDKPRAIWRRI
jgi:hypothetical protein